MAMTLRLTDEETNALRETARREDRSMQEVARAAIVAYTSGRTQRRDAALDAIFADRAELIERLRDA